MSLDLSNVSRIMLTSRKNEEVRDRRRRPRLRLSCFLRLFRLGGTAVVARTEDISCQGFYFTSEHPFELNERLECELIVQGEETGYPPEIDVVLRGKVEVVRIVPKGPRQGFGIACRLEDYTVDREIPANSAIEDLFVETPKAQASLQPVNTAKRRFLVSEES